jgi:hypothetical protein
MGGWTDGWEGEWREGGKKRWMEREMSFHLTEGPDWQCS